MLRLPSPAAQQACSSHNIAVECLKLFPRYRCVPFALPSVPCATSSLTASCRWHSILHSTVLGMVTAVLSSPEMLDAALKGGLLQANTQSPHVTFNPSTHLPIIALYKHQLLIIAYNTTRQLLIIAYNTTRLSDTAPGHHSSSTARHARRQAPSPVLHGASGQDRRRAEGHCQEGERVLKRCCDVVLVSDADDSRRTIAFAWRWSRTGILRT